jgi:biopolymer transport protein ExbD
MQTTNPSPRLSMRNALTATCLFAFAQSATAQSASPDANTDVLTVRISEDGVCHFLGDSAPCEQLGKYLLTKRLAQNRHIHIEVDRASKYELVAATLESLEGTGFKVGSLNSEPSTKPAISEGNYIGYATVADALATLKAQGLMPVPGINGEVSFAESDNKTTWTFVGKGDPAYPSAVKYVFAGSDGPAPHVEITMLCEASEAQCEKFRGDTRENVTQLSKMMAGDPSVKCRVHDVATKCGAEPIRKQSNQQIYVQVGDDGNCSIDSVATTCLDTGRKIRTEHPSDDPKVSVCAGATTKVDSVGKVLRALNEEYLTPAFGCPPSDR